MSVRRRASVVLLLAALLPSRAFAQDWDVGTRPSRPSPRPRPTRPATVRPAPPRPTAPPPPAAPASGDARDAAIERLTNLVVDDPDEGLALLATLLRMVRARDGSSERLLRALEDRRATASLGGIDLLRGEVFRDAGRFDEAIAAFHRSVAERPSRATAWLSLARLHHQLDHPAEALAAYGRAAALTTSRDGRAEILRARMDLSVATGDSTGARAAHHELTALLPGSAAVRRELADAFVARRQWSHAVGELRAVAHSLSGDLRVLPAVLRDLGTAQLRAGLAVDAEATLTRALTAGAPPAVEVDVYEGLAEIHEQRQDLGTWIESLERSPGGSAERWAFLGRRYAALGRTDGAVRALRRAITLRPRDVDLRVQLVQALNQAGRVDEALAARRALVAAVPREVRYAVDLADELQRIGRRAEAVATLTAASRQAGDDAESHEQLAQAFARVGAADLALRETERVVQLDPGDPAALEALGDRQWERGDRRGAVTTWERIRQRARNPVEGHRAIGEVFSRHDLLPDAIDAFRSALALRPDDVAATRLLAQAQEQARDLQGAVETWRRLIALPNADADLRGEARTRIANLWNLQGLLPGYATRLEEALRTDPSSVESALDLAEVYARLRRPAELERALLRVVELRPGDARAWQALERARVERGDLAGAIEALRRVVDIDPRRGREIYPRLARHALAMHRDADAVGFAARAVELNPDDAAGHRELGDLYRARGELDRASGSYRRALALNDRDFESALRLADIHLARGEAADAVDRLRSVVRRSSDDDLVGRAGRIAVQVAVAGNAADALAADLASASASAPGRAVLRRLQSDLFLAWLRPDVEALAGSDPARAEEARARLQRLSARAVRPLLDVLAEPGAERHELAVRTLGATRTPDAVQSLIAVAARADVGEATHREALRAAVSCADARAVPSLVAMLRGDDSFAAALAAWGLSRFPGPVVDQALRAALQRPGTDAAAMAALALASRRATTARPLLEAVLSRSTDGPLRAAALVAWASLSPPAVVPARLAREGAVGPWSLAASLAAMGPLASSQPALRAPLWGAALGGASAPSPPGVALTEVAAAALTRSVRGAGLFEGRAWREAVAVDGAAGMLAALFREPSPGGGAAALVRDEAVVVAALHEAVADPARRSAVVASFDAADALPPVIQEPRSALDPLAVAALQRLVDALAPALASAWGNAPPVARPALLRVLARTNDPAAVAVLRGASGLPDPAMRAFANRALASLVPGGEAPSSSALARLDPSSSWSDRLLAVEALGRSQGADATRGLGEFVERDPYAWVRRAALRLLARRIEPSVVEVLRRVRERDPDAALRAEAERALRGR